VTHSHAHTRTALTQHTHTAHTHSTRRHTHSTRRVPCQGPGGATPPFSPAAHGDVHLLVEGAITAPTARPGEPSRSLRSIPRLARALSGGCVQRTETRRWRRRRRIATPMTPTPSRCRMTATTSRSSSSTSTPAGPCSACNTRKDTAYGVETQRKGAQPRGPRCSRPATGSGSKRLAS
jgi:hypothetical protein